MTPPPTTARSYWGWGDASRFPDRETRAALAQNAQLLLGFDAPGLGDPVPLDRAQLPPSRLPGDPPCPFHVDRWERAFHTWGASYPDIHRGFHGDFGAAPDAVLRPTTEDEVVAALAWCQDQGVACVPFGGGTSVVGGVERPPDRDCSVSLDLGALNRVLDYIPSSRHARIQGGALGPAINAQLAEHGVALRHYPQSFEFSTLGGWIATRAGGHYATIYTHIDDLVASTRMVTPSGRVLQSRRLPSSGAGPSPDRLVLGSEGTLGVVTEAWMRVQPRPRWRSAATVKFKDFGAAVDATRAVAQSALFPTNCRLLDSREASLNQVSFDGTHLLILGFESADHPVQDALLRALAIALEHGGLCPEGPSHKESGRSGAAGTWRQAFLDGPYLRDTLVSAGIIVDTFETACPWDRFEELHREVIGRVREAMKQQCGAGRISCRFTHVYPDGPAPYFTLLAPGTAGRELEQWAVIKQAASDALLACGGTITHHHAVGRMHRQHWEQQRPDGFGEVLTAIKATLDPRGILNPGVLLPAPGQTGPY